MLLSLGPTPWFMEETPLLPEVLPAPPAYPTLKESWVALGWLVLISVLVALAVLIPFGATRSPKQLINLVLTFTLGSVSILLTIWWVRRRAGPLRWVGLALRGPADRWQLYALLPVVALAQALLVSTLAFLPLPNWYAGRFQELAAHPLLALGLGCVLGPICEELLFRGVLLKGLLRNYQPAVAIGQSALLFGIIHFNPAQSVGAFVIGLVLGWLYYRTHSLILCMGLHMLNNLLAFSTMLVPNLADERTMVRHLGFGWYVGLLSVAAVVLGSSW
ncbi:MAG: CPBP family glutamic-type intramembrane protease [Janthinobacterium lividum]